MNIEEVKEEIFKIEALKHEAYNKHHLIDQKLAKDRKTFDEKINEFVKEFKSRHENQWIDNYVKEKTDDIIRRFKFCPEKELENIKGESIMSYPYYDFDYHSNGIGYNIRRCSYEDDDYGNFSWQEIEEIMK
jgi:vacuolar-type H+-ATPase subunit B/Vma2